MARAAKKAAPQVFFKLVYLTAERRLGHVQPLGGTSETKLVGHNMKITNLA